MTGTGIVPPDDFTLAPGDTDSHHDRPDRHAGECGSAEGAIAARLRQSFQSNVERDCGRRYRESGELARLPRRRWRIAWLLGIGVLVNYFDRVNLSVSHDALIVAFGISDVVFGYLSSAYNWTYALCQLPIGVILDKFGVRRVGRIGTFLWSVASFAAAVTPNLSGLFGARFLLGVGEAPTFPANAKAIGLWFPAARAQACDGALRWRGQIRVGHRCAADRGRAARRVGGAGASRLPASSALAIFSTSGGSIAIRKTIRS